MASPAKSTIMPAFSLVAEMAPIDRLAEHGGCGPIVFRRMLASDAFAAAVDFVDVTRIPAGSSIGLHEHPDTEEIYIVLAGDPLITVDGVTRRLVRGDLSVVHAGGAHSLENDTDHDVEIAVVQLRVGERGSE